MAAKQHFNNFMIVVCGSHRVKEGDRERKRGVEGGREEAGRVFRGRGSRDGEKSTESIHPRLNVLCPCRLSRRRHDYAPYEHPHESSSCTQSVSYTCLMNFSPLIITFTFSIGK